MTKMQNSKPVYDLEERTFQNSGKIKMTEPWSPLFWSLDIEIWNLFVISCLYFGI